MRGREFFIEYIHDLKPPAEKLKDAAFEVQATSLLDELDSFRAGFGA